MLSRFIKVLIMFSCVFLLSSCAGSNNRELAEVLTVAVIVGDTTHSIIQERSASVVYSLGQDYASGETYNKEFITKLNDNYSSSSNSFDNFQKNVNVSDTTCSQVHLSFVGMSSFGLIFKEPFSKREMDIVKFDKLQRINKDIPIIVYPYWFPRWRTNPLGFYSLNDAVNYQWCKRTNDFANGKYIGGLDKIKDTNIMYEVNISVSTDLVSCTKAFQDRHCLVLDYKYDVSVVDTKTNKVYLTKKYDYKETTEDTIGDVAYNPLNYYIAPIVRKNRDVIEEQVLTEKLYNTLSNASQNSTTP